MPLLSVYVDLQTLARLYKEADDHGRYVDELASAAVTEAVNRTAEVPNPTAALKERRLRKVCGACGLKQSPEDHPNKMPCDREDDCSLARDLHKAHLDHA